MIISHFTIKVRRHSHMVFVYSLTESGLSEIKVDKKDFSAFE